MPKSTLRAHLDDLIARAEQGQAVPVRKDLRGCKGCKEKMLQKVRAASTQADEDRKAQRGLVLVLMRARSSKQYYRAGPTRKIQKALERGGYRVTWHDLDFRKRKHDGQQDPKCLRCRPAAVASIVAELPEKPQVIMKWEEHGCLLTDKNWRQVVDWCYKNGIVPVNVDYGYLDHYKTFGFDPCRPDGSSSVYDTIESVSRKAPDWPTAHPRIGAYVDKMETIKQAALSQGPMPELEGKKYVVLWPSFSVYLAREPFKVAGDKHAWAAFVIDKIVKAGYTPVLKQGPIGGPHAPPGCVELRGRDKQVNARVALFAHNNIVGSSTVTNEFVMWGVPCTALGRSWFAGQDVFYEPETWGDIVEPAPVIQGGRNRYLNWWLGMEWYPGPETPVALDRAIDRTYPFVLPGAGADAPEPAKDKPLSRQWTSYERLLRRWCQKIKPKRIFEWGPGRSTEIMAEECPDAEIICVEHDLKWHKKRVEELAGKATVHHQRIGNDRYAHYPIRKELGKFDLVFIDGVERCGCLLHAPQILSDRGVVLLHDANRKGYQAAMTGYRVAEQTGRTRALVPKSRPVGGPAITSSEPAVTAICPTYGRAGLLDEAVSSFLAQDYPNARMLVLNDAPEPISSPWPNVEVLNVPKPINTLGRKLQMLLEHVDTPLVSRWDDDDLYLPWHLSEAVGQLLEDGAARIIINDWTWFVDRHQDSWISKLAWRGWREGALTAYTDTLKEYGGFEPKRRGSGIALCRKIAHDGLLTRGARPKWKASLIRRFGLDGQRLTSTTSSTEFRERNTDYGDGQLRQVSLASYADRLLEGAPKHIAAGSVVKLREALGAWK